jgi:stage V sporulation protein SpoVS
VLPANPPEMSKPAVQQNTKPQPPSVANTTAKPDPFSPGHFIFLDTSKFDSSLSDTLRKAPPTLTITPEEKISPNDIPPRLEKWFSAVVKSGGKVKLQKIQPVQIITDGQPTTAVNRSFLLTEGIDLIFTIYDYVHEMVLYAPAKKYDVLIAYSGSEIRNITFEKRAVQP